MAGAPVVPGGLDEQPAGVAGAGLGDRAEAALAVGGVLGRDDAQEGRQLRGLGEAGEVADLAAQPDRRERRQAAEATQPVGRLGERR